MLCNIIIEKLREIQPLQNQDIVEHNQTFRGIELACLNTTPRSILLMQKKKQTSVLPNVQKLYPLLIPINNLLEKKILNERQSELGCPQKQIFFKFFLFLTKGSTS